MDTATPADLLWQIRTSRKLGPVAGILKLSPTYVPLEPDESLHLRLEGIISAMEPEECRRPELIVEADRIPEIALSCGESEDDVRKFLRQFEVIRQLHGG